jgi:hypothetical protein
MALVCARHHTDIHTGIWTLQIRDGIPWATPPVWIDPRRQPLRNATRHRIERARDLGRRLRRDHDRDHDRAHDRDHDEDGVDPPDDG